MGGFHDSRMMVRTPVKSSPPHAQADFSPTGASACPSLCKLTERPAILLKGRSTLWQQHTLPRTSKYIQYLQLAEVHTNSPEMLQGYCLALPSSCQTVPACSLLPSSWQGQGLEPSFAISHLPLDSKETHFCSKCKNLSLASVSSET